MVHIYTINEDMTTQKLRRSRLVQYSRPLLRSASSHTTTGNQLFSRWKRSFVPLNEYRARPRSDYSILGSVESTRRFRTVSCRLGMLCRTVSQTTSKSTVS
jgi:hypothetical protein